ncbi:MAG: flavodoxin-dependent (E)-4-hydroxy-3-methylbut-2-enyl-diphosphate synthase [bacterium]
MENRRKTRAVKIGDTAIGSNNPILVQSMCNTDTSDFSSTYKQIKKLQKNGCEIVRVAVPNKKCLTALDMLIKRVKIPIVADIHFNYRLALASLDLGVCKIRINPGNIGGRKKYLEVLKKAEKCGAAVRLGVNSGSLDKSLLKKYGHPVPEALAESALNYADIADDAGFSRLVVSIKSTDAWSNYRANKIFSKKTDVPLHLGITEAGTPEYGAVKSAVGLGALLINGIGDTIRVSLTGDPVLEIKAAFDILKASGRRITTPEIISCPTCGRVQIDLEATVKSIEKQIKGKKLPIKVAVLGCVVNGPGEASEADVGIAGGNGMGIIFRKGREVARVPEKKMVEALVNEINKLEACFSGIKSTG